VLRHHFYTRRNYKEFSSHYYEQSKTYSKRKRKGIIE